VQRHGRGLAVRVDDQLHRQRPRQRHDVLLVDLGHQGGGEGPKSLAANATSFDVASAPQNLAAAPGSGIGDVQLSWDGPASNGGRPVTGYRLYRGTDPSHLTAVADLAAGMGSYVDHNGELLTTYCYLLSALNAVGEGPTSKQAAKPFPWVPITAQASVDVSAGGVRAGVTPTATL
jgi:hypothetical protein